MKNSLLLLLLILVSSCAKDHVMPAANLSYVSIEREDQSFLYDIHYKSDINFLDLFGKGESEGVASAILECALGDDQDISVERFRQLSAYGVIEADQVKTDGQSYRYVTSAFFKRTIKNGTGDDDLSIKEINSILLNKSSIPCKAVLTAYGYKPYYSNVMNVPVADLLREVNKP
ncbi:hypothetical protein AL066_15555 [Pseudomonas nunensis]|nr:hypothetical protein AL066_15555 [Pseudomonas nunensis]